MGKLFARLLSKLNDIKIMRKMILLYVCCIIIPIVIINLLFYISVTDNVMTKEMDNLNLSMDRIRVGFSTSIEQCIRVCEIINVDKRLNQSLDTTYPTDTDYVNEYKAYLENEVNKFIIAYSHISSITIYVSNNSIVNGGNYKRLTSAEKESSVYKSLFSQNKAQILQWIDDDTNTASESKYVGVISKCNFYKSPYEKMIEIKLNNDILSWIAMNEKSEGNLYLISDKNESVLEYIKNKSLHTDALANIKESSRSGNDIIIVKDFGASGPMEGWRLVGIYSKAKLVNSLRASGTRIILLALLLFTLATLILLIISFSIEKRLKIVSLYLKSTRAAEHLVLDIEPGKDEIGNLIVELNNRVERTRHLIDVVYKGEVEKTRAELLALQSQIHPHFLYNTLNSIRLKSVLKNEMETASVIKRLALLFRRIMDWQEEFIYIKEEVAFIIDFLEIQKYRYEDKLSYLIHVEENALNCRIPKMVLQPLVENASFHGTEMSQRNGVIELIIRIRNNSLYCIVKDNGIGIQKEKMMNIQNIISGQGGDATENIGIYNVYKRLKFYYNDRMSLRVVSFPEKGTVVVIKIQLPE